MCVCALSSSRSRPHRIIMGEKYFLHLHQTCNQKEEKKEEEEVTRRHQASVQSDDDDKYVALQTERSFFEMWSAQFDLEQRFIFCS